MNVMGVYIKGLTLNQLEKIDGIVWGREGVKLPPERVVEVPEPHGRLIDVDVLCEKLMTEWLTDDESGKKIIYEVMTDVVTPIVVGTPTVIEAEGE